MKGIIKVNTRFKFLPHANKYSTPALHRPTETSLHHINKTQLYLLGLQPKFNPKTEK